MNAYNEGLGYIARAESAQTPSEVIEHVTMAKNLLPQHGSVPWWLSGKGDFQTIQAELDDIIMRARSISSVESENELFISEMFAMHADLRAIEEALV